MRNYRGIFGSLLFGLALILTFISLTTFGGAPQPPKNDPSAEWVNYYPLAVGNEWVYAVHTQGKSKSSVVRWKVTQVTRENDRTIFMVHPKPSEADDDWMELSPAEVGLEDIRANVFILKSPLYQGGRWNKEFQSTLKNRKVSRTLSTISAGKPCEVGKFKFSDCVEIEDVDEEQDQKTDTTYTRNVGPVAFKYYEHIEKSGSYKLDQTLVLLSYSLKRPSNN